MYVTHRFLFLQQSPRRYTCSTYANGDNVTQIIFEPVFLTERCEQIRSSSAPQYVTESGNKSECWWSGMKGLSILELIFELQLLRTSSLLLSHMCSLQWWRGVIIPREILSDIQNNGSLIIRQRQTKGGFSFLKWRQKAEMTTGASRFYQLPY